MRNGSVPEESRRYTFWFRRKVQKRNWWSFARENARMVLDKDRERIRREEGRTIGAVHEGRGMAGIERYLYE